ncbi:hypothetical protein MMC29_006493 [Sticta canariensis]|nr:hypothetical protein [Sticta canariensis]
MRLFCMSRHAGDAYIKAFASFTGATLLDDPVNSLIPFLGTSPSIASAASNPSLARFLARDPPTFSAAAGIGYGGIQFVPVVDDDQENTDPQWE